MDYRRVEKDGVVYVELLPGAKLASERDAVETVGLCGQEETHLLMLHEGNLSDNFFDLKTGLAGELLLKWSTYFMRVAAVISPERIGRGRFYEFVIETNRGRQFFVANDRQSAEDWLLRAKK